MQLFFLIHFADHFTTQLLSASRIVGTNVSFDSNNEAKPQISKLAEKKQLVTPAHAHILFHDENILTAHCFITTQLTHPSRTGN